MTHRIGLIVGMEDDFPPTFIERVSKHEGCHAEILKLGGIPERYERYYDVIVSPARSGPNDVHVTAVSKGGGPTDVLSYSVTFSEPVRSI